MSFMSWLQLLQILCKMLIFSECLFKFNYTFVKQYLEEVYGELKKGY